uniref:XK-related protein n=1 Tax=Saccoglossus kowalevskii TaxID=10224 RepID=A0ABM0MNE9_SACKO|nr:PREDICTED: XK-related protein 6-like [Saccoglossus kowalevskii]
MALPRKKTVAEEKDDNGGFIDVEQVSTKKSRLQPAMEYSFGFPELLFVLVSIISFIVDIATDIIVTREYVQDTEYLWAGLTIGLILLPSIVMQIFSCIWYINDSDMTWWKWLIHGFQLSPLFRYINVIKTGIVAQRTKEIVDFQRLYHKQNDACMLRLFEAFLESAPQLILQMYIMLTTDGDKTWTVLRMQLELKLLMADSMMADSRLADSMMADSRLDKRMADSRLADSVMADSRLGKRMPSIG